MVCLPKGKAEAFCQEIEVSVYVKSTVRRFDVGVHCPACMHA